VYNEHIYLHKAAQKKNSTEIVELFSIYNERVYSHKAAQKKNRKKNSTKIMIERVKKHSTRARDVSHGHCHV